MEASRLVLSALLGVVPAAVLFVYLRRTSMRDQPWWQPAVLCVGLVAVFVAASAVGAATADAP